MTSGPDTIGLRAYTRKPGSQPLAKRKRGAALDEPSPYVLVFDTETNIDPSQALRVGFYQVRKSGVLIEEGAFYPPYLPDDELTDLRTYCEPRGFRVRTLADFSEHVLLKYGYDLGGVIAGFNLPFDISRVAIHHGPARGSMRGGFSFQLVASRNRPRVQVKHLSRRASLIQFSSFWDQPTPRGMRKRGLKVDHHKGCFVDVKTLSAALTSRSHSLESLCAALDVPTRKIASEAHGGPLTPDYLDYARDDVQATWECYAALTALYEKHALAVPAHKIISEASIGKAYLDEMSIAPLQACQDVPGDMFGLIMSTFYGGRAEVRIRRVPVEVRYTDFKSMYPTVNALMGLWPFVIAEGFTSADTTQETRAFLESVTREDFQARETWQALTTLVQIQPDGGLVPVRAKYDASPHANYTIGLNYLSYRGAIWYTLADVIAAKVLTGKTPRIVEAISFYPGKPQSELKAIRLFGNPEYAIDPLESDAFTRLIDLRDEAKAAKDPNELAIKILANSTSYGIYIEVQRDNAPKPEPLEIYGPNGFEGLLQSTALEDPGRFFHPLLGTLITGAARLMLALAERETLAQGLQWAFCDTDSLAIARPEGMGRDEFETRVKRVVAWFEPLNPYRKPGSILQMEDVNYAANGNGEFQPLYAFAISAKRYALFNIDSEGRPVIRKASAHGLGHLRAPYGEADPAPGVPDPVASWSKLGVTRWQYDHWYFILSAALGGRPERVRLDYHPALTKPAAQRYGATSPHLLKWMDPHNAHKSYPDQIKPFGFLVSFTALAATQRPMPDDTNADPNKRGRPRKEAAPKPVAPFESDPGLAARQAFDRETGEPVSVEALKTYADALATYHLSPESKFENGDRWDAGETVRRHVQADHVILIGKEANGVGEFGERLDPTATVQIQLESGEAA
ncbi:hypothetical protein L2D00_05895 [Hyphomonadaceae bacterium BL14]|nr:hypothetical protein L2D00_05895 [Hyphomonadaceae bacterium BL14]